MSRIAPPAEKVLAIGSIFRALAEELKVPIESLVMVKSDEPPQTFPGATEWLRGATVIPPNPHIIAMLIDCATRVAMATDTRDLGILGAKPEPVFVKHVRFPDHYEYEPCWADEEDRTEYCHHADE